MDSRAAELLAALSFGAVPTAGVVLWTAGWRGARRPGKHEQDAANLAQPRQAGTLQGSLVGGDRVRYTSLRSGETGEETAQVMVGQ